MKTLYVYYEQQRVGVLTKDSEDIFQFTYDEKWTLFPLSLSMPLHKSVFGNRISKSYFENLLPEGDVRKNLEVSQGISGVFDFLDQYGKDCAGAVVISASTEAPVPSRRPNHTEIDMDLIYKAIANKESVADVIAEMDPGYLSLAGAQDKFPAIYEDGKLYLPEAGGATTHIVKTPIRRMSIKESVYNEYYCMRLADLIGMYIPHCEVLSGKEPLFVIERYDRHKTTTGLVSRIHQQDFCQAQGILSDDKYEINGGPSLVDNYNLILDHVAGSKKFKALETYLDWICFNLIIGNNDCHSKNISFLFHENRLQLTPFYDLLCTAVYPRLKSNFAFFIGGRNKYSEISLNQYRLLEEQLEIKPGTFVQKLNQMYQLISDFKEIALLDVQEEFPEVKIFKRINDVIHSRLKNLHRHGVIE